MKALRRIVPILLVPLLFSCSSNDAQPDPSDPPEGGGQASALPDFVKAVDISALPQILDEGVTYRNAAGVPVDVVDFMKSQGVNTARIRLWVNPADQRSGLAEVKQLAGSLRSKGIRIWITAHYSDTWADPGKQVIPGAWQTLGFEALKAQVSQYTTQVITEIQPDIYQIGNEINPGLLLPKGDRFANRSQFLELLAAAAASVRAAKPDTQIMLHFAGISGAPSFYQDVSTIDYDLIGISYYPKWHGKSLATLENALETLGGTYGKEVLLAETAYPFTLDFGDLTQNLYGLESELILPDYPATRQGQKNFLTDVFDLTRRTSRGKGVCYWAPEWIAYKGGQSQEGSPWENLALFDFDFKALPGWEAFNTGS